MNGTEHVDKQTINTLCMPALQQWFPHLLFRNKPELSHRFPQQPHRYFLSFLFSLTTICHGYYCTGFIIFIPSSFFKWGRISCIPPFEQSAFCLI